MNKTKSEPEIESEEANKNRKNEDDLSSTGHSSPETDEFYETKNEPNMVASEQMIEDQSIVKNAENTEIPNTSDSQKKVEDNYEHTLPRTGGPFTAPASSVQIRSRRTPTNLNTDVQRPTENSSLLEKEPLPNNTAARRRGTSRNESLSNKRSLSKERVGQWLNSGLTFNANQGHVVQPRNEGSAGTSARYPGSSESSKECIRESERLNNLQRKPGHSTGYRTDHLKVDIVKDEYIDTNDVPGQYSRINQQTQLREQPMYASGQKMSENGFASEEFVRRPVGRSFISYQDQNIRTRPESFQLPREGFQNKRPKGDRNFKLGQRGSLDGRRSPESLSDGGSSSWSGQPQSATGVSDRCEPAGNRRLSDSSGLSYPGSRTGSNQNYMSTRPTGVPLSSANDSIISTATLSDGGASCRICREGDTNEVLISPCYCAGSMGLIHISCLQRWLGTSNNTCCEICHFRFSLRRKSLPFREFLKNPGSVQDKRNLTCDIVAFCTITPLTLATTWMSMAGALQYYKTNRWERTGLIVLSGSLLAIYMIWLTVALRHNYRLWRDWKMFHQEVTLLGMPPENKDQQQSGPEGQTGSISSRNTTGSVHLQNVRISVTGPFGRHRPSSSRVSLAKNQNTEGNSRQKLSTQTRSPPKSQQIRSTEFSPKSGNLPNAGNQNTLMSDRSQTHHMFSDGTRQNGRSNHGRDNTIYYRNVQESVGVRPARSGTVDSIRYQYSNSAIPYLQQGGNVRILEGRYNMCYLPDNDHSLNRLRSHSDTAVAESTEGHRSFENKNNNNSNQWADKNCPLINSGNRTDKDSTNMLSVKLSNAKITSAGIGEGFATDKSDVKPDSTVGCSTVISECNNTNTLCEGNELITGTEEVIVQTGTTVMRVKATNV